LFRLGLFVGIGETFPFNSPTYISKYFLGENLHGNLLNTGVSTIIDVGSLNSEPA
jgi:hypothetical protein